jgi:hypothetical protein
MLGCVGDVDTEPRPTPCTVGTSVTPLKICEAMLALSGSFAPSTPKPDDVAGCWPVGRWTFSATVEMNSCEQPPKLEPQYQFDVVRDAEDVETYAYFTDPADERAFIKVTSGGGGLCEGGLLIYSDDGKEILNLKPALQADQTLNGFGEYDVYQCDQF